MGTSLKLTEKSEQWLKKYPNYGLYLFKVALSMWFLGGLLLHFWNSDWDPVKAMEENNILDSIFWVFFMVLFDYFVIYHTNKNSHLKKSQEAKFE